MLLFGSLSRTGGQTTLVLNIRSLIILDITFDLHTGVSIVNAVFPYQSSPVCPIRSTIFADVAAKVRKVLLSTIFNCFPHPALPCLHSWCYPSSPFSWILQAALPWIASPDVYVRRGQCHQQSPVLLLGRT